MNDVTDFLMFMFNVWTEDTCNQIFGDLGPHIWTKWQYAVETYRHNSLPYFWTSIDTKRQNMLLTASNEHWK